MAPTVFFLLLAIWMQELMLVGIAAAGPIGVALLAATTFELLRYRRRADAQASLSATLEALGRASRGRRRTTTRPAVRPVSLSR